MGILTDRDIVVRAMGAELPPDTPVGELMTRNIITLSEEEDVFEATRQMATFSCRRLPVIGRDGRVKGVVSLDDLLHVFAGHTDSLAAIGAQTAGVLVQTRGEPA